MEHDHPHDISPAPESMGPDPSAVIEQVRELLFGDHRRATEASVKALEDKLAALTATLEARHADMERRLHEAQTQSDTARDNNVAAIGAALMELGERLKGLVGKPQG